MYLAPTASRLRALPGKVASSLRQRNYRLYFVGQLISMAGTWMQTVAQSFLVLGLTHSGTQLGLTIAARFLPILLFGPLGGLFADRLDKRRVLFVTQALSGLLAAAFAVLVATHSAQLWIVYLLALALGFVNVFDNPARQAFISEMVSAQDLPNAVTLNSVSISMARIFGAVLGGVIVAALGLALCFACNAVSFGAVLLSLAAMRRSELYPAKRVTRRRRQVREGLRYVRTTPELLVPLVMIAVVGTLAWEFQVTLPLMASKPFHGGAATYAAMTSLMGAGAVIGGLISAARARPRARALCLAAIGWGVAILAAAAAPSLPLELAAMVFVGYGSITFNSYAKTTLQLAAMPSMRGRVMALWALAWVGSTPVGGPIVGWAGQVAGARWSLVIGGLSTLACGILALPALIRVDRRREAMVQPGDSGGLRIRTFPQAVHQIRSGGRSDARSAVDAREHFRKMVLPLTSPGPRAGEGGTMNEDRPPITVVGAGGIGGTVAAALTLAGDRVTVVDASVSHIEGIRTRGLHFDGIQGDHYLDFEQALLPEEWEAPADIVFLAVKSQHTREALRVITPRLHADSVVVSLQNGWNPTVIADAVGADRTMAVMIHMVGNHEGPGHVRRYSEGTFHLGELSQTLTPRAVALAERLSAAVPTTATDNVWGFIWSKQICGTTKAATALVDELAADIVKHDWVKDILLALILEGIAAADAEGIRLEAYERLDPDIMRVSAAADMPAARAMLPKGSAKGNSGVWHDIKIRRRKTEVDYLSGELVRIGRRHGLPMAVNGRVVEMISEIEAGIRPMAWDNLRELRLPAAGVIATALGSVA